MCASVGRHPALHPAPRPLSWHPERRLCRGNGQVALSTSPPRSSPVKQWLLPTVKGILQVPHQVGLAGHAEEALLGEPTLPDEVHTLLHQQRRQAGAVLLLMVDCVLQPLPKDPWAQRGAGHTLS